MAGPLLRDRVKETSVTTGSGAFTLDGAVTGYRTFASAVSVGDTFPYCIAAQGGTEWEVGIGTLTAGTTLGRTTVLASSNAGSLVNFSAGNKDVFLTYPAERAVIKIGTLTAGSIPFANANGELAQNNAELFWDNTNNRLGAGTISPGFKHTIIETDLTPSGVTVVLAIGHNTTTSPVGAGMGTALRFLCESTTTDDRPQATVESSWNVATDASRAADLALYVYSTGTAQEGLRIRAAAGGVQLGFFAVTPIARASAYTQTYSTADKTHANPVATALTDSTTGTADGTMAAMPASYNQTTLNNNFAELTTQVNNLITDLADLKQLVNSVIDDLQAYGLLQ